MPRIWLPGEASFAMGARESMRLMRTASEMPATVTPNRHTMVAPIGQSLTYESTAPEIETTNAIAHAQ